MKTNFAALIIALLLCLGCIALAEGMPVADYAAVMQPDFASDTLKQEVTVIAFVDGDTTHFSVPETMVEDGVLRARYLGINTPESTGRVDAWGKAASRFTKEKLSGASSILIESDTNQWNPDTTGGRYLVWVWYRNSETEPYRNLNIELLQQGLARINNTNNRYGEICALALAQAKEQKLCLWSDNPDPEYSYGNIQEVTVKELRLHPERYEGQKVAFDAVIIGSGSNSVYVESFDAETDRHYGMYVYYGRSFTGPGLSILVPGNEVRIVGTMQYYENGGIYEITSLTYWAMDPTHPDNLQLRNTGLAPSYPLTSAEAFNSQVTVETEEGSLTFVYPALVLDTSIAMEHLTVISAYQNENKSSSSYGAMTLTCEHSGVQVTVYTVALYDRNHTLLTCDAFLGKTVSVRGIVEVHNGDYQIKVFSLNGIAIQE